MMPYVWMAARFRKRLGQHPQEDRRESAGTRRGRAAVLSGPAIRMRNGDSAVPFLGSNPRYRSWIEEIKGELSQIRVIADKPANPRWNFPSAFEARANWRGFEARLAN